MNRVARNSAKKIAASAIKPASIPVSAAIMVLVYVEVMLSGAGTDICVQVVTLVWVMIEKAVTVDVWNW
jgi:hypothetical protein